MPDRIDFLIIGSQRCGTSSLFHSLRLHPDICGPEKKELNFWGHWIYKKDFKWYFNHFENCADKRLVGEASPSYSLLRKSEIDYIYRTFPHLKIILLTRDPVDRMWSSMKRIWTYSYMKDTKDLPADFLSILKYINQPSNIRFGLYFDIYKRWTRYYLPENICHIRFEDLSNNPHFVEKKLEAFFGIKEFNLQTDRKNISKIKKDILQEEKISYLLSRIYFKSNKKFARQFPETTNRTIWPNNDQKLNLWDRFWINFLAYSMLTIINIVYPVYFGLDNFIRKYKLSNRY